MLAMTACRLFMFSWGVALLHLLIKTLVVNTDRDGFSRGNFMLNIQINVAFIPLCLLWTLFAVLPPFFSYLYRGPVIRAQARFYGFRGVADLQSIDQTLFGSSENRISWSTFNPRDTEANAQGLHADHEENRKVFTLVDTWLLTANTFRAQDPPSVVMVAGKQGGLLRALLCSYDSAAQIFCRETVLRMETKVLQRMSRIDQCKVSLGPKQRFTDHSIDQRVIALDSLTPRESIGER